MDEFSYKDAAFAWTSILCICFPRNGHIRLPDDDDIIDTTSNNDPNLENDPHSLSNILTSSPFSRKTTNNNLDLQIEDADMLPDEHISSFSRYVDDQVRKSQHSQTNDDNSNKKLNPIFDQNQQDILSLSLSPPPPFNQDNFPISSISTIPSQTSSSFNQSRRISDSQRLAFRRLDTLNNEEGSLPSLPSLPSGLVEFFPFAGTLDDDQILHIPINSRNRPRDDSLSTDSNDDNDDDAADAAAGNLGNGRDRIESIYRIFM